MDFIFTATMGVVITMTVVEYLVTFQEMMILDVDRVRVRIHVFGGECPDERVIIRSQELIPVQHLHTTPDHIAICAAQDVVIAHTSDDDRGNLNHSHVDDIVVTFATDVEVGGIAFTDGVCDENSGSAFGRDFQIRTV